MTRRFLYLNSHGLSAYAWQRGRLVAEGVFTTGESLDAFAQYLAEHPRSFFSLLTDAADENHVQEEIPFLRGDNRRALIARKLRQHFNDMTLVTTTSLGYETSERKNEKLLFSALTNPEHLQPWLSRLQQTGVPLAGIFSTSQLGGGLLKKLGYNTKHCLLLTLNEHSIAESHLVDGLAVFCRTVPVADDDIANAFSVETIKLLQYLIGQRQIERDESLPVFIIAHPSAISVIKPTCGNLKNIRFHFIDSHASLRKLKGTPPPESHSEYLFLHLLASSRPDVQFADASLLRHARIEKIRFSLVVAGMAALLASSSFAANEIRHAYHLYDESRNLGHQEADIYRQYKGLSATFPQLGIDETTLRQIAGQYIRFEKQQQLPNRAYLNLSQVLNRFPAIMLERIEWGIRISGKPGDEISEAQENTTIHGTIRLDESTPRQIVDTFDQFVSALRSETGTRLNVLDRPLEIGPDSVLRGGDEEGTKNGAHQFVIEIVRETAHET